MLAHLRALAVMQAQFWLNVAEIGKQCGDVSLAAAAMCFYFRHWPIATFRMDDLPFLYYIGRDDRARELELVRTSLFTFLIRHL